MWTKVMRRKNTLGEYQLEAGRPIKGFARGIPATSARSIGRDALIARTLMLRQKPLGPPERDFVQRRKISIMNAYGIVGRPEVPTFGESPIGPKHGRGHHVKIKRTRGGFLKRHY